MITLCGMGLGYNRPTKEETTRRYTIVSYNCGKPGHPERCPNNEVLFGCESKVKVKEGMYCKGTVEGCHHIVRHSMLPHNGSETVGSLRQVLGREMGVNQMCAW